MQKIYEKLKAKCLSATELQKSGSRIFIKCLAAIALAKVCKPHTPNNTIMKKLTKRETKTTTISIPRSARAKLALKIPRKKSRVTIRGALKRQAEINNNLTPEANSMEQASETKKKFKHSCFDTCCLLTHAFKHTAFYHAAY